MSVYMLREASQPAPPNNIKRWGKTKGERGKRVEKGIFMVGRYENDAHTMRDGGGISTALILWKATETGMKLKQNDWKTLSLVLPVN